MLQLLMNAVANVPMAIVVVWVVYILLTRTLPGMQAVSQELQKAQLDFCSRIVAEERESCEKRHGELRQDWVTLTKDQRDNHRENLDGQKEIRHCLADMANAVSLRRMAEKIEGERPGQPDA